MANLALDIRLEVLKILKDAPNYTLQWIELKNKIFDKFKVKKDKWNKLFSEKSINSTLERALQDLRNKDYHCLLDRKGEPKNRFYFIPKNKYDEVRKMLDSATEKRKLSNLIDFLETPAETKIVNNGLSALTLYLWGTEEAKAERQKAIIDLTNLLTKLRNRSRLNKLIELRAPQVVVDIGKKAATTPELISYSEVLLFYGYPVDEEDAKHNNTINLDDEGLKTHTDFLRNEKHPEYAKILEERYKVVLGL